MFLSLTLRLLNYTRCRAKSLVILPLTIKGPAECLLEDIVRLFSDLSYYLSVVDLQHHFNSKLKSGNISLNAFFLANACCTT